MGPITLLTRAKVQVDVFSSNDQVIGKHKVSINQIKNLDEAEYKDYDMLFLPGGPHYSKLENSKRTIEILKYFYENKKPIASICAAPTILGKLGMLKGRKYTCFTPMNEDFGGEYVHTHTVQDDFILTGRAAAAAIDLGFLMINYLLGEETENKIKESVFY